MSLSVTSQVCKNNWTCDAICRESLICVAGVGKNADLRHYYAGPATLLRWTCDGLASNLQQYMVVLVTICDPTCHVFRGTNSESEDKVSLNDGGEGFRRKPGTEIYVHPPHGWGGHQSNIPTVQGVGIRFPRRAPRVLTALVRPQGSGL